MRALASLLLSPMIYNFIFGFHKLYKSANYLEDRDEVEIVTVHFDFWGHAYRQTESVIISDREDPLHIKLRTEHEYYQTYLKEIRERKIDGIHENMMMALCGRAYST